jgi:hypothetical protein
MPNADGTMTRYEYRRIQQRCIRCGKKDAYTMNGRAYCAECAEKRRENQKIYYNRHKREYIAKNKAKVDARREAGICVRCGKKPAAPGHVTCARCLRKLLDNDRASRRKQGIISREEARDRGICTRCMKEPVVEGHGLCRSCLDWWLSVRNSEKKTEFFTFMGG